MNILLAISMTAATLGLTGCLAQSSEPTPKLQHALLIEPNSAKVADAITQLLHSSQVQLTDDVFVTSSTVTLEQLNHKDPQGNTIMGKQLNMPDQVKLMIKGKSCFVRHLDSKATIELKQVLCKINPQR